VTVPKGQGWYLISRPGQRSNPALTKFRQWLRRELRQE
jgi:DNA-binding transcriptional LysR family regulator